MRFGRFNIGISSSCILYRIGSTVIDTGPPNQWRLVRKFLSERDVHRVVITHHHEDHSGNGARLERDMNADVFLPSESVELMRRGFPLRAYQRLFWGVPVRFEAKSVPDELSLERGFLLRAIPAPGHSSDMTCYLEPNRGWLFTGDLYIASKPRFLRADENLAEQIESLRGVLELDFETVFCAHRGVVTNGCEAIKAKLDYLVSLRDEVRKLHAEGRSVSEIKLTLLGPERMLSFITMFHFSKKNLIEACLR